MTETSGLAFIRGLLSAFAENQPVRKVAVVGNAPLAPDSERAALIDDCDLVIRCNSFVLDTPDHAPTQGKKVHAVMFPRGLLATPNFWHDYHNRAYLVLEPSRVYPHKNLARYVKDWPSWWPPDAGWVPIPNHDFTIPLLQEMDEDWENNLIVPTSGTMTVYVAMRCFPEAEIRITGFSMIDNPNQTQWVHQSGDVSPIGGAHFIDQESKLYHHWLAAGKLRRI